MSRKISWSFFAIGVGFLFLGLAVTSQGIEACKTGAIVPASVKIPSMTGLQSIITGLVMTVAGVGFLINEVRKMIARK